MEAEIADLLKRIADEAALIDREVEILSETKSEISEALRDIRRRQNEIIKDVEDIARSVQTDDLTDAVD